MAGSTRTAKKAAAAPPTPEEPAVSPSSVDTGTGTAPAPEATTTDAGGHTYVLAYDGVDDGPVTFSRGDESYDFDVKDSRITTTKERAEWLVNYTAARPVAEKE